MDTRVDATVEAVGLTPQYRDGVIGFLTTEFSTTATSPRPSVVDAVVAELIGTGQIRNGPAPCDASRSAIRNLIERCVAGGRPIPVLVPSGPKKPGIGRGIDVAEWAALRVLACLHHRITAVYPPGTEIRIRLEDVTGWIFEGKSDEVIRSIDRYLTEFECLVLVLGYGSFITPVRESSIVTYDQLWGATQKLMPLIRAYLEESEREGLERYEELQSWKVLAAQGWRGELPLGMRRFYLERYRTLYPELPPDEHAYMMVRYLASTLARNNLHASGASPDWTGNIQLNFAPPVPGIPRSLAATRVYYRTVPLSISRRHLPYWRARGFIRLNSRVDMSLASWREEVLLNDCTVVLRRGSSSACVKADYQLA